MSGHDYREHWNNFFVKLNTDILKCYHTSLSPFKRINKKTIPLKLLQILSNGAPMTNRHGPLKTWQNKSGKSVCFSDHWDWTSYFPAGWVPLK